MKTKILSITILLFFSIINSQTLDELYTKFMNNHSHSEDHVTHGEKCGFGLISSIKSNFDQFSSEQQAVLKKLLSRPEKDTSVVSPKGYFRIHFNLTGSDRPFYEFPNMTHEDSTNVFVMVDSLAAAFDFSYDYEINTLGYPVPPSDNGNGGDDRIDVYVRNFASGVYGQTVFEDDLGDNKLTSYIEIDDNFVGNYFVPGLQAAKVTAAHELHHVIQIGVYGLWSSDVWFYEVTSTSMEEFVYDDINDYYGQISNYLGRTHQTIKSNSGYNLTILNLFFQEKYNVDFIKRVWEYIDDVPPLQAISNALLENGSNFAEAFNEFGIWTYFTGYRTQPGKYFEEAANYPVLNSIFDMDFSSPTTSFSVNSAPVSNNFIFFANNEDGKNDTIVALVTNSDITSAINSSSTITQFDYTLGSSSFPGSLKLVDGYYKNLGSDSPGLLLDKAFFNNLLIEDGVVSETADFAFPNPFNYSSHVRIFIPTDSNLEGFVDLNIYSISMDLVYSGQQNIVNNFVNWNALDNNNNKLPTGIYFYATRSGDSVNKGKIAIYNE